MAVGWSQRARADLGAIFAHIAADNRGAAERWIGRILEHTDLAAEAPLLGRVVPELGQADPEGYASPEKTVDVCITELAKGSPAPLFEARCTALAHSLVVAIRAENGPNLPVVYLGKELARTDAEGVAHVVLKVPPGETASLRLDTSGAPALKPQNPEMMFKASNRDEMVLLEQKFSIVRKVVVVRAKARPQPL